MLVLVIVAVYIVGSEWREAPALIGPPFSSRKYALLILYSGPALITNRPKCLPYRMHLNNKSEPKNMLILQVVHIDSGLNMHSEDLLPGIDMPLKSKKRHLKGLSCFFPPFPCQHTHLQSGSSITAEQRGKLDTRWENGFCWRGMENKILLMYLVKVKERRKWKFIPHNYKYFSYWWTDCRRICSYGCNYIS